MIPQEEVQPSVSIPKSRLDFLRTGRGILIGGFGILLVLFALYYFLYLQGTVLVANKAWQITVSYNQTTDSLSLQNVGLLTKKFSIDFKTVSPTFYSLSLQDADGYILYTIPIYINELAATTTFSAPYFESGTTIRISKRDRDVLIISVSKKSSFNDQSPLLFFVKPVYAAGGFSSVSFEGPTVIKKGVDPTYNATVFGTNLDRVELWRIHVGSYYDSDEDGEKIGETSCTSLTRDACLVSTLFDPQPDWYGHSILIVKAWSRNGEKCLAHPTRSDNPWTSTQGQRWFRCGTADFKEIDAQVPTKDDLANANKNTSSGGSGRTKPKPTATPTPVLYRCSYDPRCDSSNPNTIQFCTLKCVRN